MEYWPKIAVCICLYFIVAGYVAILRNLRVLRRFPKVSNPDFCLKAKTYKVELERSAPTLRRLVLWPLYLFGLI